MKCPTCGEKTEGRNHNGRGLRCTFCWALLPDESDPPEMPTFEPESPEPKRVRKRKPAAKSGR